MKKLFALIVIVIAIFALGVVMSVYSDPLADEKWAKPQVSNLIAEPEASLLKVEKSALISMLKTTLTVYDQTKASSQLRVSDLKSTLLLLSASLVICIAFIVFLLFNIKRNIQMNT